MKFAGVVDRRAAGFRTRVPLVVRFWQKVDKAGPVHPVLGTPCWLWTGATNDKGYGQIQRGPRGGGLVYAHRFSYELVRGQLPAGLVPDHLCNRPSCVNPAHLEAVTHSENIRRAPKYNKPHCADGHDPKDYVRGKNGRRYCRGCNRERMRVQRP